jgi:transposase
MARLEDVPLERLVEKLEAVEDRTATLRLVTAINYKQGLSVSRIAEMYGLPRRTVYDWFDRLEERELDAALADRRPPGREPSLRPAQRESVRRALASPPPLAVAGYDAEEWTPELLRLHVLRAYDREFSLRHARRLLDRLRPVDPDPDPDHGADADPGGGTGADAD